MSNATAYVHIKITRPDFPLAAREALVKEYGPDRLFIFWEHLLCPLRDLKVIQEFLTSYKITYEVI